MHNTGIYEIRNTVSGKRYIGSAVHFKYRWGKHLKELREGRHHSRHLQNAWNRHGQDAFEFHKLIICARDNLLMYEQIAMDAYKPQYNVLPRAGSPLGVKRNKETIAKTVASRKANGGWSPSEETRAKISQTLKGRTGFKHTEESIQRMREAQGKRSREHLEVLWEKKRGVPRAEYVRRKLSEAVAKFTEEQVRQIRLRYESGELQKQLAESFGVRQSCISEIVRGVSYAWVK